MNYFPAHPSAQSVSVAESDGTECNAGCETFLGCKLCNRCLPGQENAPLDLRLEPLSFLPPGKP